eukprot:6996089-Pyramimonas_sp.AAC.1
MEPSARMNIPVESVPCLKRMSPSLSLIVVKRFWKMFRSEALGTLKKGHMACSRFVVMVA